MLFPRKFSLKVKLEEVVSVKSMGDHDMIISVVDIQPICIIHVLPWITLTIKSVNAIMDLILHQGLHP